MNFEICKDLSQCGKLWKEFSVNRRLFDVWDFRQCFIDSEYNEPHFIVGYEKNDVIGIIPLYFDRKLNQHTYCGGWFPERNSFFLKDKTKFAEFLAQCPGNTFVQGIDPTENKYYHFLDDEYTYYLDLSKYNYSFEEYFDSFSTKRQKNLRHDLRSIPDHKIYYNRIEDFERLVELSNKRYKENSIFNEQLVKNAISRVISVADKKGILRMISLEINGRVEAVDVGILFGEYYYALIGSANNKVIPNLGKLMAVLDIKDAIENKAKFVDFGATASNWKDKWNLQKDMLLKFVK